jgi:hypothetical protein
MLPVKKVGYDNISILLVVAGVALTGIAWVYFHGLEAFLRQQR